MGQFGSSTRRICVCRPGGVFDADPACRHHAQCTTFTAFYVSWDVSMVGTVPCVGAGCLFRTDGRTANRILAFFFGSTAYFPDVWDDRTRKLLVGANSPSVGFSCWFFR